MNKLDTSNGKYFSLGDERYFKIYRIKKPITLTGYSISRTKGEGKFPVICSSQENNGVAGGITDKNGEEMLHLGNAITIAQDGSIFSSFYQPFNFYTRINMLIFRLERKELNHYLAFFLCSVISLEKNKYSYGRTLKTGDIGKTKIPLPHNEKGEPDGLWMENYSRKIFEKVKESIIKLIDTHTHTHTRELVFILIIGKNLKLAIIFILRVPKTPKRKIFCQEESLLI